MKGLESGQANLTANVNELTKTSARNEEAIKGLHSGQANLTANINELTANVNELTKTVNDIHDLQVKQYIRAARNTQAIQFLNSH